MAIRTMDKAKPKNNPKPAAKKSLFDKEFDV